MPALSNTHHENFAQAVASGAPPWQAYMRYKPNAQKSTALSAGYKLAKKALIEARITEIQQSTAKSLDVVRVASKQRLLEMLTDIVFTAPDELDASSPLVQEITQVTVRTKRKKIKTGKDDEAEETSRVVKTKLKMVSKSFAIKQLALMMGYNAPLKVDGEIRVKGLREFVQSIRRPGLPREVHR